MEKNICIYNKDNNYNVLIMLCTKSTSCFAQQLTLRTQWSGVLPARTQKRPLHRHFRSRGLLNVRNCGWRRGYALAGVFAVYSRRAKANTVPIKATTARH